MSDEPKNLKQALDDIRGDVSPLRKDGNLYDELVDLRTDERRAGMSVGYKGCNVVSVHWVDSCGFDSGWVDNDDLESLKPKEITTVGHLIEESDDYVVIAPTIGDEQNFGSLCIPKCSVLKINILTESEYEMD